MGICGLVSSQSGKDAIDLAGVRLLHSLSLAAVGLSVGYEAFAANGCAVGCVIG